MGFESEKLVARTLKELHFQRRWLLDNEIMLAGKEYQSIWQAMAIADAEGLDSLPRRSLQTVPRTKWQAYSMYSMARALMRLSTKESEATAHQWTARAEQVLATPELRSLFTREHTAAAEPEEVSVRRLIDALEAQSSVRLGRLTRTPAFLAGLLQMLANEIPQHAPTERGG